MLAGVKAGASQAAMEKLLLGGEMASWSESVDDANFAQRIFTRGVAVAERLWSPMSVNDTTEATPRLMSWRCKAKQRGIKAGPTFPGYCSVVAAEPAPTPAPTSHKSPAHGATDRSRANAPMQSPSDQCEKDDSLMLFVIVGIVAIFMIAVALFIWFKRAKAQPFVPLDDDSESM